MTVGRSGFINHKYTFFENLVQDFLFIQNSTFSENGGKGLRERVEHRKGGSEGERRISPDGERRI